MLSTKDAQEAFLAQIDREIAAIGKGPPHYRLAPLVSPCKCPCGPCGDGDGCCKGPLCLSTRG